jgi:hypothetical protein
MNLRWVWTVWLDGVLMDGRMGSPVDRPGVVCHYACIRVRRTGTRDRLGIWASGRRSVLSFGRSVWGKEANDKDELFGLDGYWRVGDRRYVSMCACIVSGERI